MILRPQKEGGIQISWGAKHSLLGIGGKRASGGGRRGGGNEMKPLLGRSGFCSMGGYGWSGTGCESTRNWQRGKENGCSASPNHRKERKDNTVIE